MKNLFYYIFLIATMTLNSQKIIELPFEKSALVNWEGNEKEYFSEIWQTQVVTNVSVPTMEVFQAANPNGTSVIIAPGGGLYALSINSEGRDVAKWLNKKGITAFVLKYRLVPTGEDGVQEISDIGVNNPAKLGETVSPVLPLAIADGLAAITYVREHATDYKIDSNKLGFMGFSAGGAVTMGVTFNYSESTRPNFIVPVYPWMTVLGDYQVPQDAPKMLVICATDDPLGLAAPSIDLYSSWHQQNKSTGIHMFSKGGHGFGMKKQGLASDNWISRFYEWALTEGFTIE